MLNPRNIIDFFESVTGLVPTQAQKDFLLALADSTIKKVIVSSGRRCGKTLCVAVYCLWLVFDYTKTVDKPLNVLLVSAQENEIYNHMKDIFTRQPDLTSEVVTKGRDGPIPVKGFDLNNGCKVWARGATGGQIRGKGADVVIIDEACDVKRKIITTAKGTLQGDLFKFILTSTAHELRSYFVEVAEDAENRGYKHYTWSELDCPWLDKELIDDKKKEFTRVEFMIEVEGKIPPRSERAFFAHKHIKECTVDGIMPMGGAREAGLDFGEVVGKNILTISEKNKSRRKVLYQKHYTKPLEECLEEITETLRKYEVKIVKADSKPAEYQKIVGKKLGSVPVMYVDAAFNKDKMLGQLQRHIQQHTIEIDQSQVKLILELKKYRKGKRAGDDRVDSLALSCYEVPYKTKPEVRVIF